LTGERRGDQIIGAASLAAVPLVTAGFFSKDLILWYAWNADSGGVWLWAAGLLGALLTSVYTFRMVLLVFFGEANRQTSYKPGGVLSIPLLVLAFFSIVAGWIDVPENLGGAARLSQWLHSALPAAEHAAAGRTIQTVLQVTAAIVSLLGVAVAYWLFLRRPGAVGQLTATSYGTALHRLWFNNWGFDAFYDRCIVRPYLWIARTNRADVVDRPFRAVAWICRRLWYRLHQTQTGTVRWYAAGVAVGAVFLLVIVVWL